MDLFKVFMLQVLDDPDLADEIPQDAELIFLPENDDELRQANLELAERMRGEGIEPVFVKVSYVPKMELVKSA